MRKTLACLGAMIGLWAALGCAGVSEKLLEMSGTEIAMGEDAEHPTDFPLPPPDEGELLTSMKMGLAGMKTETVQYKLPGSVDEAAVLKKYEDVMTAAGHTVQQQNQDGVTTITAQVGDGEIITAAISVAGDDKVLSLVAVTKE